MEDWEDVEVEEVKAADGRIVYRISEEKVIFPKVSVARGGIRYHWEKEDNDVESLTSRRKKLADKISKDLYYVPGKEWSKTIDDALSSYGEMLLEEMQERLDKEV